MNSKATGVFIRRDWSSHSHTQRAAVGRPHKARGGNWICTNHLPKDKPQNKPPLLTSQSWIPRKSMSLLKYCILLCYKQR